MRSGALGRLCEPAPKTNRSAAPPPIMTSPPLPACSRSDPGPPSRRSLPARPYSRSWPDSPNSASPSLEPARCSPPPVPRLIPCDGSSSKAPMSGCPSGEGRGSPRWSVDRSVGLRPGQGRVRGRVEQGHGLGRAAIVREHAARHAGAGDRRGLGEHRRGRRDSRDRQPIEAVARRCRTDCGRCSR